MASTDIDISLISRIYEAALEPRLWDELIVDIGGVMKSNVAALTQQDPQTGRAEIVVHNNGQSEEGRRSYEEYYGTISPTFRDSAHKPVGAVYTDSMYPDLDGYRKTEFYNDYLVRHECEHLMQVQAVRDDRQIGTVLFRRRAKDGPYGQREMDLLAMLSPHFRQAFRIHRRLCSIESRARSLELSLDGINCALILLDESGSPVHCNDAAAAILNQRDGLYDSRSGLRAADHRESDQLSFLIAGALGISSGNAGTPCGMMGVTRPSGRRPYGVMVAPIIRRERLFSPQAPAAALFVTDPETCSEPPVELLRRQWNLTPKEADLAQRLTAGLSLSEAADEMEITQGTARNHLKRLFEKTETHRQSEMVRLLLSGPSVKI